jgi:hypothetical protein
MPDPFISGQISAGLYKAMRFDGLRTPRPRRMVASAPAETERYNAVRANNLGGMTAWPLLLMRSARRPRC